MVHLLHLGVDPLTHLCPTVGHKHRAVLVNVDQSGSLLGAGTLALLVEYS